jgi:hypothetical protein
MLKWTVEKVKKLLAQYGLPTDINIEITDKVPQGYYPNGVYPGAFHTPDHEAMLKELESPPDLKERRKKYQETYYPKNKKDS